MVEAQCHANSFTRERQYQGSRDNTHKMKICASLENVSVKPTKKYTFAKCVALVEMAHRKNAKSSTKKHFFTVLEAPISSSRLWYTACTTSTWCRFTKEYMQNAYSQLLFSIFDFMPNCKLLRRAIESEVVRYIHVSKCHTFKTEIYCRICYRAIEVLQIASIFSE